jgi:hypothetical protein
MKKPVETFTNKDDGMESYVFENDRGGYNVTMKDLDSGDFIPTAFTGIKDLKKAIEKAKKIVGVKTAMYDYDRSGTSKQASVSSEAQRAFDDEVYPRVIAGIMEQAKREISKEMLGISNGKWPDEQIEYSVMRHRPMRMMPEDFTDEIMSAFIDWTRDKFNK